MNPIFASLFSIKVLFWQIFLGIVQGIGLYIGGKKGLFFAYGIVLFWTITQTHSGLLALQFIIQSIIAYILYHKQKSS